MIEASADARIDVVLPLRAGSVDRAARLAIPSILHFFEPLGTLWLVTTASGLPLAKARISDPRVRIIAETEAIPELHLYQPMEAAAKKDIPRVSTTTQLQQTLKLAMARMVTTPFYLCVDADTLCVQPTRYDDLVIEGRAATRVVRIRNKSAAAIAGGLWPGNARPQGSAPVVLPVEGVEVFLEHIAKRLVPHRLRPEIYLLSAEDGFEELSIYFDVLKTLGLLGTYHQPAPRLTGNNVRTMSGAAQWRVLASFEPNVPFRFSSLSRRAFPDPEVLASRLRRHWPAESGQSPF